ncbi:hypothetical protein [Streptomyces sp. NPDC023327]|uniref:hypothetical protein n=1 Tax=Streptomyces sp. NPDC023327 TaxID=3157088 RepID=UPI0033D00293
MYLDDVRQPLLQHLAFVDLTDLHGQGEYIRERPAATLAKPQEQADREKDPFASLAQRTTPASPA